MKQFTLTEREFQTMLDAVKHTVSWDDARPALHYIRINVDKQSMAAYSLDGYRASRFVLHCANENKDEFVCYIKPIPFKASKNEMLPVNISTDDKTTTVEYCTKYGRVQYKFEHPEIEYPDIEKVYREAAEHDREVSANARYIQQAMQAIASMTPRAVDKVCIIESKDNPCAPIIMRGKADNMENTQLILPVRTI